MCDEFFLGLELGKGFEVFFADDEVVIDEGGFEGWLLLFGFLTEIFQYLGWLAGVLLDDKDAGGAFEDFFFEVLEVEVGVVEVL